MGGTSRFIKCRESRSVLGNGLADTSLQAEPGWVHINLIGLLEDMGYVVDCKKRDRKTQCKSECTLQTEHKTGVFEGSYVDYKKGRANSIQDPRRQKISTGYGDDAARQTKGYVGEETVTPEDVVAFQDSLKSLDFSATNKEVEGTEGMEHRTDVKSRDVALTGKFGSHLFIEVDPTNYDPNGKTRYISLDGKVFGGTPEINTVDGFPNDRTAIQNNTIRETQTITVPKGMTEQEFDQRVIQEAERFDPTLPENQYPIFGGVLDRNKPNSNTFVDNVIENSGGEIRDFDRAVNQNVGE